MENPVRFGAALRRRPTTAVALGLGLSAIVVSVALVSTSFPPPISSTARAPGLTEALTTAPNPESRLTALLSASTTALPRNLTPRLADIKAKRSAVYRDNCHVDYTGTRSPACVYGDPTAPKVVVLYGDQPRREPPGGELCGGAGSGAGPGAAEAGVGRRVTPGSGMDEHGSPKAGVAGSTAPRASASGLP